MPRSPAKSPAKTPTKIESRSSTPSRSQTPVAPVKETCCRRIINYFRNDYVYFISIASTIFFGLLMFTYFTDSNGKLVSFQHGFKAIRENKGAELYSTIVYFVSLLFTCLSAVARRYD